MSFNFSIFISKKYYLMLYFIETYYLKIFSRLKINNLCKRKINNLWRRNK